MRENQSTTPFPSNRGGWIDKSKSKPLSFSLI